MALNHNTRVSAQMLARLIEQFKDKERIRALIAAIATQLQDIENASYQLFSEMSINTAIGVQLDMLGELVGQPRLGLEDEKYRDWIAARILLNHTRGTVDETIQILELIAVNISNAPVYSVTEEYPAGYTVQLYNFQGDPVNLFRILRAGKPAGVAFLFEHSGSPVTGIFSFSSTDIIQTDENSGFADETEITGGTFVGAMR